MLLGNSIKKELAGFEVNERFYEIGSFFRLGRV